MDSMRAAEREAASRRETPTTYDGLDLRAMARVYSRVLGIKTPPMRVRHSPERGVSSGRAWDHRIVLTLGAAVPRHEIMHLLLHELAHVATPGHNHDEVFCAAMVRAARTLWGVKVEGWSTVERGHHRNRAYAIDHMIRVELAENLAERMRP
jgi:hypothetical protein